MRAALPILLLLVLGCERRAPAAPPVPDTPPSGSGIHQDGQTTLFRPVGVIAYGDDVEGDVPNQRALQGYEFEATAGDEPVVSVSGPGRVAVALYGPRGSNGLWDNALQSDAAAENVTLSGQALPASGMYFILIRTLDAEPLPYRMQLRCGDGPCAETDCAVEPCDLYCPTGYAFDDALCRVCACSEPACEPGSCPDGERCVQGVCVERRCEDDCPRELNPVCGEDGQTYRTACNAACRGVEVANQGSCTPAGCSDERPCPDPLICQEGRCIERPCECPDIRAPVCDTRGRTHPNECLMMCAGAELDYPGPCVEGFCRGDDGCADGESCDPVPDPVNLRRCMQAPESEECIRRCVQAEPCGDGPPCAAGDQCARLDEETAFCTRPCREPGEACDAERTCTEFPGRAARICMPNCGRERECPGQLTCHATASGPVCLPGAANCPCPPPGPNETVCIDGTTYASPCFARCAGANVEDLTRGACDDMRPPEPEPEEPVCDCAIMREPLICGADRRIYASRCDARCNRVEPLRLEQCLPVRQACRVDDDCIRTGCEGRVCASERTEMCPELTGSAACRVRADTCGCVEGLCQFTLTRESVACIERLQSR
jgi:hypothetical protein